MLRKYRKTALIEAEQFDGSVGMMRKYSIKADPEGHYFSGFPLFTLLTKEGKMSIRVGDWIATGIDREHWAIAPDIFEKTYERCD
ncbi:hypothetical protein [Limosilactobacillus reuteri]|uniref:hypothetical protein n=1 Tax=Limosilactobacillus reuteri TaxID=1598 RepID=UPI00214BAFDD|nr:hypothetical protein [Limosilactobacillus reuteri]MCR1878944.1 hypothetical protein [Limosilactobacillus reuteri]